MKGESGRCGRNFRRAGQAKESSVPPPIRPATQLTPTTEREASFFRVLPAVFYRAARFNGGRREAGGRRREAGGRKQEAGSRKQEAGSAARQQTPHAKTVLPTATTVGSRNRRQPRCETDTPPLHRTADRPAPDAAQPPAKGQGKPAAQGRTPHPAKPDNPTQDHTAAGQGRTLRRTKKPGTPVHPRLTGRLSPSRYLRLARC